MVSSLATAGMDFNRSHSQSLGDCDNVQESDEHLQQLAQQGAATGNLSLLMDAVNHDPSVLESQDEKGMTPLSHAVINKQLDMVKLLVRMGAGINAQDVTGRTPLCLAAYEGWYQGVVYLLRSGAKQSIPDRNGRLPLHAATYDSDSKTLSALLQPLTIGDINETDNDGMTALHWAAFHNRPEHVQLLMLRGADIYGADVDEKTPLHWASQNGGLACCSSMAKCRSGGAPLINAMEGSGKSCVHLAAAAGYSEILEEFADIPGVDFEALDPDDRTPLHWASVSGQEDCVKFLLELGVMHSPRDINNCTPLDYAKQANKPICMKELIKTGAEYGVTPAPSKQEKSPKDGGGTGSRKNSGTKKKRFGFLSDIFSRTKNGLRSKQSSVESNEEDATNNVSNDTNLQPSEYTKDEPNDQNLNLDKEKVVENRQIDKPTGCLSDISNVCDSNQSDRNMSQRSLSNICTSDDVLSNICTSDDVIPDTNRNRSASIPQSSPLVNRIPSFPHHALLPSSPMGSGCKTLPGATSSSKRAMHSGYMGCHGDICEPIVGLKPLCRDLPDAVTVQRHAQEILEAQRGLMSSKDEGDTSTAARSLSHMSLVTNPKLAPLSPKVLGRWHSTGSHQCEVSSPGIQSGHSTESLTFELTTEGQSSGTESIGLRSNVLDPISDQQRDKRKRRKKRASSKKLERKPAVDVDASLEPATIDLLSDQPISQPASQYDLASNSMADYR